MHAGMEGPPHPNMSGRSESFKMAALFPERYETTSDRATTVDTCHVSRVTLPYIHNDTGAFVNATLLTYLLNGEILLFVQT